MMSASKKKASTKAATTRMTNTVGNSFMFMLRRKGQEAGSSGRSVSAATDGELLGAEVPGARQLQVAGAENDRRERRALARRSDALHTPTHLNEPGGEPAHDVVVIDDMDG
jgi:hypothetical protein